MEAGSHLRQKNPGGVLMRCIVLAALLVSIGMIVLVIAVDRYMARPEDVAASNPLHEEFLAETATLQKERNITVSRSQQRGSTTFVIVGALEEAEKAKLRQVASRLQKKYGRTVKLRFNETDKAGYLRGIRKYSRNTMQPGIPYAPAESRKAVWNRAIGLHGETGYLLFLDGSVSQVDSVGLEKAFNQGGNTTNRIAIP